MKNMVSPSRIIFGSFVLTALIGAFLLMLPISSADGKGLNFIDAFFTATSATCVTGLVVVDTGKHFSKFGQIVILLLIQAGGLGIMTLSSFFIAILGRRISLRSKLILQDALNFYDMESLMELVRSVVLFTLLFEFIGFILITTDLKINYNYSWSKAMYFAVFHSISAFCNAGFSLYSDSLVRFVEDPIMNLTVMMLIIMGGIGFPVIMDIYRNAKLKIKGKRSRISFHTKIVVTTTAILIISGAILFFIAEIRHNLYGLSFKGKILASLFQSVTPRTAGFNTIDIGTLKELTWLIIIPLMFIGASPGGTGGGIKTTTFLSLVLFSSAVARKRSQTVIFGHTIPQRTIDKSIAIFFISLSIIMLATSIIAFIEHDIPIIKILFETFSAFGTVGLSTGITPALSAPSKLTIIALMFIGRVGPLTAAIAMAESATQADIKYPEGEILVG